MSETQAENTTETEPETTVEIDPIEVIHKGQCPSLSSRSTLEFAIGRHSAHGTLHLAVTGNSGRGMWCKDWASAKAIQDVVLGEEGLTAKSFHCLHEGRSINTGGFILAALKELGLIRANDENTRLHEHVPGLTFEKAVAAYFTSNDAAPAKPARRKAKEG